MAQSGPVWATIISCLDYWSRILFLPGSPTQFFSYRVILSQCKPGHTALLSKLSVASILQSQSNICIVAFKALCHQSLTTCLTFWTIVSLLAYSLPEQLVSLLLVLGSPACCCHKSSALPIPLKGLAEMVFSPWFLAECPLWRYIPMLPPFPSAYSVHPYKTHHHLFTNASPLMLSLKMINTCLICSLPCPQT